MNTTTHIIAGLTIVPNKDQRGAIFIAVMVGALLPDLPMFGFYGYEKLMQVPESTIWGQHYYAPRWQAFFDLFNSIPLICLGLMAAYAARSHLLGAGLLSMLIHTLCDLPVHHDDGHRHFFPLSNWRFESPISYWDPAHYGHIFGWVEFALVVAACVWLYRRYRGPMRFTAVGLGLLHAVFTGFALIYWGFGV